MSREGRAGATNAQPGSPSDMTGSDMTQPSEAAVAPAETPPPNAPARSEPAAAPEETPPPKSPAPAGRAMAIVLFVIVAAISALSLWYLFQTQPLVVQGEADATRIDIAARVDGLLLERPVERSDNVAAGQLLLVI